MAKNTPDRIIDTPETPTAGRASQYSGGATPSVAVLPDHAHDGTANSGALLAGYAELSGTPTAGQVASWVDGDTVGDAGFAAADVARLNQAQTFTTQQRITPDSGAAVSLWLDTAASPSAPIFMLYRNGTYKQSIRLVDDNFVEERRNFVALADTGIIALPYAVYKVEVIDASGGTYFLGYCQGGVNNVQELIQVGGVWTTVKDTAASFNLYYESSAYHLQNLRGVSRNVSIWIARGTATP